MSNCKLQRDKSRAEHKVSRPWTDLTSMGQLFGTTAARMGKKLKEVGLRGTDGNPTQEAVQAHIAKTQITSVVVPGGRKIEKPIVYWHRHNTTEFLIQSGLVALDSPKNDMFFLAAHADRVWIRAQRLMKRGEDRMARYAADGLVDYVHGYFTDTVARKDQLSKGFALFEALTGKFGHTEDDAKFILSGCDISFEQIKRHGLVRMAEITTGKELAVEAKKSTLPIM